MKKIVKYLFKKSGYQIFKNIRDTRLPDHSEYEKLLFLLRPTATKKLSAVIVGANDGKINDPMYNWIKLNKDKIDVVLFEPQEFLYKELQNNYKGVNHKIIPAAVGPEGSLNLYRLREQYWHEYRPWFVPNQWPSHRAASGIVSSNREHLIRQLKRHMRLSSQEIDKRIEKFEVPSNSLINYFDTYKIDKKIDIVQVDTEGYDDVVIQNCNLDILKPSIIRFESKHLSDKSLHELERFLIGLNYVITSIDDDALAIRVNDAI